MSGLLPAFARAIFSSAIIMATSFGVTSVPVYAVPQRLLHKRQLLPQVVDRAFLSLYHVESISHLAVHLRTPLLCLDPQLMLLRRVVAQSADSVARCRRKICA